jgi:hypothetical protein
METDNERNDPPFRQFFVFRSFVEKNLQRELVNEALKCHARNSDDGALHQKVEASFSESNASEKLNLGISCGGDLSWNLPKAATVARKALGCTRHSTTNKYLSKICEESTPLTGIALLYGQNASMPAHYDSPTQPGQREEWLVMITLGLTVEFRCNTETLMLKSGDVIVMDSMAVLHGVVRIEPGSNACEQLGLPVQSRLGILFWHGREQACATGSPGRADVGGIDSLFFEVDQND